MLQYGILLTIISCVSSQSLTSSITVVKKPGESVTLSCTVSGFSMSSHWMHWVRQKPQSPLEWIGFIDRGTTAYYAQSLQGQFSITKDNSKNMLLLEIKSLKLEDTAVYYCARDAFDYWGKGTQVTVTSTELKLPAKLMMSECSSSDSGMRGCLASGYFPGTEVSFKWTDQSGKALTDFVQYPRVTTGEKTLKFSHINVTQNKANVKCELVHSFKKAPTLSLIPVTTQKSTSVICVIEDFYPDNVTVQWKVNNTNMQQQTKMDNDKNKGTGLYITQGLYVVSSEVWDEHIDYTCEVTHMGQVKSEKKNFKAVLALTLKTPIQRELFLFNKVILQAVVSGNERNSVESALVSCKIENEAITLHKDDVPSTKDISEFRTIYNVTVDTEKWFEGQKVTCSIIDKNIKEEIYFNKGDAKTPKVSLYEQEIDSTDPTHISLVCEVNSPKLGDVYIMWKFENEKKYEEGYTSAPILREDSTSVVSIYKVSKEVYGKKNTLSCSVKHANMDKNKTPIIKSTSQSKSKCPACPVCSSDY